MNTDLSFPLASARQEGSATESERSGFSGPSRQSLLDNVPLQGSFSFKREQLEQRR